MKNTHGNTTLEVSREENAINKVGNTIRKGSPMTEALVCQFGISGQKDKINKEEYSRSAFSV